MSKKTKGAGSQDIRSFFQPKSLITPKSSAPVFSSKKRAIAIVSSDEDIIPESPVVNKQEKVFKKRKVNIESSDSEDEKNFTTNKEVKQKKLKPVSVIDAFGSQPVKQTKIPDVPKAEKSIDTKDASNVKKKRKSKQQDSSNNKSLDVKTSSHDKDRKQCITELGIHDDPDFEKTLLELDEDFLIENVNELDKTIDEALNPGKNVEANYATISKKSKSDDKEKGEDDKNSQIVKKKSTEDKKDKIKPMKSEDKEKEEDDKNSQIEKKKSTEDKKDKVKPLKSKSSSKSTKPPKEQESNEFDNDLAQEKYEKKRHSAMLYQKYLNRSGPVHRGSKEIPKGEIDCLNNLCFIRTGVLDSLDNDDFEEVIKSHGGRVVHSVSKKVSYVVAGEDPGPAKLEKAQNYGIKIISEDELLDLIRIKSGIKPIHNQEDNLSQGSLENSTDKKEEVIRPEISLKTTKKVDENSNKGKPTSQGSLNQKKEKLQTNACSTVTSKSVESIKQVKSDESKELTNNSYLSWTEKYKPVNTKGIIGQQDEKSNMKRLKSWLENWYKNHSGKNKPKLIKPSPWAKNDDGSYFKAALLSGSPGVGKTTTANLVAKELGFDVVEFNASDTRSKKLLNDEVSRLLNSKSLASFFLDGSEPTNKHVLLMDEVDGMAGNEDRGGMQELISLIKNTKIPIICMCNDRNHQKIRSLANYCLDLRFSRPKLEQIRGAMMSVCFKEGIKITPNALTEVINGAGMDIRQILTHLSIWSTENKSLSTETAAKEAKSSQKDTPLGQWEICQKVFSAREHENMTLADRTRLFYHDYSLAPLFVHENYLGVVPSAPKKDHLKLLSLAADAISMGDLIDTKIRRTNNWSLLDVEAMCASVLPGYYMEGQFNKQINFPGWLGKNSKKNKFTRLLSELQGHMRTSISGSKMAVNLDYINHLRDKIVTPLLKKRSDGIPEALEVMHTYNLLRDDLDSIVELAQWPRQINPTNLIDSKVKAAFTRAYNKDTTMLPYAIEAPAIKKRGTATSEVDEFQLEVEDELASDNNDDIDDDDVMKDAMVKTKKAATRKKSSKSSEPGTSSTKRSAETSKITTKKTKRK